MTRLQEEISPVVEEKVSQLTVETIGTHVYFYAEVTQDRVLDMIKQVRDLDNMLRNERISRDMPDGVGVVPIWLHVQSGGGSLFAGFSAADQLTQIKTPVYSIVEGYSASAATLISMSCSRRFILPNGFMLIHQLSDFMWGSYREFQDEMKLLDMAMDRLVDFYTSRSNLKKKEVKKLLGRDSWFGARECLKLGLVDEIKGV